MDGARRGLGASGGQRWSDLPAWRRWLVYLIIGLGFVLGVVIAAQGDEVRASAMGSIAIFTYALCILLCTGHAYVAFRRRESWWMRGGMLLLALIFAGLLYDSVA
jgi:uncharacterized membrane protein YoaK (UPF0700 family)